MHSRFTLRAVVAVVAIGLAAAGCGRYSFANLKAKKNFNEANAFYTGGNFRQAAAKYEEVVKDPGVIQNDPAVGGAAYFYLANSYDNLYKPGRKGEDSNDQNLKKAEENYLKAAQVASEPIIKRRAIEYLVALYAPDKLNTPEKSIPLVEQLVQIDANDPANYHVLGKVYEDSAKLAEAEAAYRKAIDLRPTNAESYQILAGFHNRQGNFDKTMEAMQERARVDSRNPEAFHQMATWYWEKVNKDHTTSRAKKLEYVAAGLKAEDTALSINPEYFEAVTYKGLLLREQEKLETNAARKQQLLKEAEQLYQRALELQKKQQANAAAAPSGRGR